MSSSSSTSSSSSSGDGTSVSGELLELFIDKAKGDAKIKDWKKITGIVIAVIGGLLAALPVLSFMNVIPVSIAGGHDVACILFGAGICVAAVGGAIFYVRHQKGQG